jgi:ferredoxin
MRLKRKVTIIINADECVGKWCAVCASVCPTEAITINETARIDPDKCNGCKKCTKNICPNYAISVSDPRGEMD